MDYGKLSKETLIVLCEERGLPYSSSWSKAKLEDLLINSQLEEKKAATTAKTNVKTTGATGEKVFDPNSGALVTQIFLVIPLFLYTLCWMAFTIMGVGVLFGEYSSAASKVIFSMMAITFFAIIYIYTIMIAYIKEYRRTGKYRVFVIVVGLFCGLIGGILVLLAPSNDEEYAANQPNDEKILSNKKETASMLYKLTIASLVVSVIFVLLLMINAIFSYINLQGVAQDVADGYGDEEWLSHMRMRFYRNLFLPLIVLIPVVLNVFSMLIIKNYINTGEGENKMLIWSISSIFNPMASAIAISKLYWNKSNQVE